MIVFAWIFLFEDIENIYVDRTLYFGLMEIFDG